MKLYISGPMGNYPKLNKPEFDIADQLLTLAGYTTINPWSSPLNADDYPGKADLKWEDYIESDLKMMLNEGFQGVAVLANSEWSPGSNAEVNLAKLLRKPVLPLGVWLEKAGVYCSSQVESNKKRAEVGLSLV